VRARLADIQRRSESEAETQPAVQPLQREVTGSVTTPFQPSPGMEVDLRGQRAEDALDMLERYLESAYLANMPFVRIIHGKGTGKLRQVIREALRAHPNVRSFETGTDKEGGDGVTVVKFKE